MTVTMRFGDISIKYYADSNKMFLESEDGEAMELNLIKFEKMLKAFYRENF